MAHATAEGGRPENHQAEPVRLQQWRAVRRAQEGDVDAFEELYRINAGRIHGLCLRMTGSREDAEELTQEAFVRAWQRLSSFRGDSAFSSWLYRIAVNVVLGRRRAMRRRPSSDASVEDLDLPARQGNRKHDLAMDMDRAIAGLPPGARMAFVLHEIEGYRHREIAELTGLAVGTLKAQLHRARNLLKEALQS